MAETPPKPPEQADEDALDEALTETFPASDPIAVGQIEGPPVAARAEHDPDNAPKRKADDRGDAR